MLEIGKSIIFIGFFISITGFVIYFFGDKFNFLGNLPGDFKYETKNIKIFIPISSMLIISLVLSVLINFFSKFFK